MVRVTEGVRERVEKGGRGMVRVTEGVRKRVEKGVGQGKRERGREGRRKRGIGKGKVG